MTDFTKMLNKACDQVDAYIDAYNASRKKLREIMGEAAVILHHARQDPDGFIKACAARGVTVSDRAYDELALLVIKTLFHRQGDDQRQRFNIRALVLCAALKQYKCKEFVAEDVARWIADENGGLTKIAADYRASKKDDPVDDDAEDTTPKAKVVRQQSQSRSRKPKVVIDPDYLSELVAKGGRINLAAEITEDGNLKIISAADRVAANDNTQTNINKEVA
ncbi:hypothetical protein GCM10011332_29480 [Terasakiella brassicae]|uniref:Uncharacterized protein n=1 Tax=Terasakiella brassicae TaxID=1634917 RepID=A0A917C7A8_9PROT|nr:hypothetical protein [Terasakiella brassicae]GGF73522.1 hypothetical protein GCM10011332_29480 [Terasakiella brassicae]